MRTLPAELAAHLATGATTLCWCWRLTRRDGTRLGFTDHDRDLEVDGTMFEAAAGFTASEMRDAVGLSVDNLEVESALSSTRIAEADILAGLYDDATVEIMRVNWQAPGDYVVMRTGTLGEVRRNGLGFTAEVRGLSHYLQQPDGRLYQYACDAELGDSRCRADLDDPAFRGDGIVTAAASARLLGVTGLEAFPAGWFSRGRLTFTSGENAGRMLEVKRHAAPVGGLVTIELWQELASAPAPGDAFAIIAGCDKQLATCTARFGNVVNFRGFPHMPGNDFVTSVARPGKSATFVGSARS